MPAEMDRNHRQCTHNQVRTSDGEFIAVSFVGVLLLVFCHMLFSQLSVNSLFCSDKCNNFFSFFVQL